jgi:hypothetical protein
LSATRKAAIDAVIRRAIADYHRARAEVAEAEASFGEESSLDPMMCVVQDRANDAEATLVRAILGNGTGPGYGGRMEKRLWPSRGVRCDGRLYLVSPAEDNPGTLKEGESRKDGADAMLLTVIDQGDVEDVGTLAKDPVYHPDGSRIWHIDDEMEGEADQLVERIPQAVEIEADEDLGDDEPAEVPKGLYRDDELEVIDTRPGRPIPSGRRDRRKMPLARMVSTFVDPSDNWPVCLEVIVLTGAREDDHTASEADLPELQQPGWDDHKLGPLTLYTRVVVA